MSRETLRTLVHTANPVPDASQQPADEIDALISNIERRTSMVKQDERSPEHVRLMEGGSEKRRGRPAALALAGAAFALVIVVVGGLALFAGPTPTTVVGTSGPTSTAVTTTESGVGPTKPPSDQTTTTTTAPPSEFTEAEQAVLDELVAAFNAGDVERFAAVFQPWTLYNTDFAGIGVVTAIETWGDLLQQEMTWRAILDSRLTVAECVFTFGHHVCEATVTDVLGSVAYRLTIEFEAGELSYYWMRTSGNSAAHVHPFKQWVEVNHPDDFGEMFRATGPDDPAPLLQAGSDSMALWALRVPEYLESIGG